MNEIIPWEEVILCILMTEEETTESGIILGAEKATDANRKPDKGVIVAVGKPKDIKKKLPIALKAGDIVFFERYTKNPVIHKGKEYCFVRFQHLMGVIQK